MAYHLARKVVHDLCANDAIRRRVISVLEELIQSLVSRRLMNKIDDNALMQTFEIENVPLLYQMVERPTPHACNWWNVGLVRCEHNNKQLKNDPTIFPLFYRYVWCAGSFNVV
jgi:hypothetical protein